MELSELKRKVQAARRFDVDIGNGRSITMQRPSRFDLQMAGARSGMTGGNTPGSRLQWERLVVSGAVVHWVGIVARDFGAESTEPVPFDADATTLLIDAQPEWGDQLSEALWREMAKADDIEGAAQKN